MMNEDQEIKIGLTCSDNSNSSEIPNSSDWKGGDVGEVNGEKLLVISYHPLHPSIVVVETNDNEYLSVGVDMLKKPETPQQREERERLEAIEDMTNYLNNLSPHCKEKMEYVAREIVDKTNYRITK